MLRRSIVLLMITTLLLSACGQAAPTSDDLTTRTIRIVTTTSMITDIVQQVGGSRVEVTGLMGAGVDPHLYKASEGDVSRLSQADIIFYHGLHLEAGMIGIVERMRETGVNAVEVTGGINQTLLLKSVDDKKAYDPHVWFDVKLWIKAVQTVNAAMGEIDPGSAALYTANTERYVAELEQLHTYVQEQIAKLPAERRVLITAHDAFHYFGRAYGFEVRGLQGVSTVAEAGTADVQELSDFIVQRQIPAIFVESSVPQRTIEAVQAAVKAKGFDVTIGGSLFSDAMGNPGTPEGTYIGMVRHNVDTIVSALGG